MEAAKRPGKNPQSLSIPATQAARLAPKTEVGQSAKKLRVGTPTSELTLLGSFITAWLLARPTPPSGR